MQLSDISLLGVAIVVVMMACCGGLFIMLDKRMASRIGRVLVYYTLSLVVACLYVLGFFKV
jgi:MFS-type transporter involved in bile tolerance (Atg22 family)